jgi:hypothetical protein
MLLRTAVEEPPISCGAARDGTLRGMAQKEIRLDLAAFVDSAPARALFATPDGPAPAVVRRIAEAFFTAAYDEVGKHPRLLDGDDLRVLAAELLPGFFAPRDPAAEHVPTVLERLLAHLQETEVVPHAFELRRALDDATDAFLALVRSGKNERRRVSAAEARPFVHGAPKLGRNDPCSCGSGKKYKKCHGKDA